MKAKTRMMTLVAVLVVAAVTRCGDESLLGPGLDDLDIENSEGPDENPGGHEEVVKFPVCFSNGTGEIDSAIDMIKAAAGEAKHLIITMESGSEAVAFDGDTDLGAAGLVLTYTEGNTQNSTSPASVVIEGAGRTVDLTGMAGGSLITVGKGVTLTLKNITLKGLNAANNGESNNTAALIYVEGGHLIIEEGAVIMDNNSTSSSGEYAGGGVGGRTGKITMMGGEISGNKAKNGGGICIDSPDDMDAPAYNGELFEFTMSGGEIIGNNANDCGGGIEMVNDSFMFVMSGGTISGNEAVTGGGADFIFDGTASMTGGYISGNTAIEGGGVSAFFGVTFTMSGGAEISGNNATSGVGGGVLFYDDVGAIFTMSGEAEISGNTASEGGGGVYAVGTFTMSGEAEISGNTASDEGGGVYAVGTFVKIGGVIYGNEGVAGANKNTSTTAQGHAVYVEIENGYKKRDRTAGTSISLDSGGNNGWVVVNN